MGFKWNERYNVGIKEVDNQHQELVEITNVLLEECKKGAGRESIEKSINFLDTYINKHFKDEESVHKKFKYPWTEEHKNMHIVFSEELKNIKKEYHETGKTAVVVIKINQMMGNWFIGHIIQEDRRFSEYLKQINSKSL